MSYKDIVPTGCPFEFIQPPPKVAFKGRVFSPLAEVAFNPFSSNSNPESLISTISVTCVLHEDGANSEKEIQLNKKIHGNNGKITWDVVSSTFIATFDQFRVFASAYDDYINGKWVKKT